MISFGPVPSRRLGRSLGINNIPPKVCTYSCVYCQVGRTTEMKINRSEFYHPERVIREVRAKINQVKSSGETIDYLTFVPDGEPTLDINLGKEIEMLGEYGIKTAVITNSSLLWRPEARKDLLKADWVSVKVDSTSEKVWREVNRPHPGLKLESILDGILEFSQAYRGELTTETMLLNDLNDGLEHLEELAGYLALVKPVKAYLAIPTRPPAESGVRSPDEATINRSYHILNEHLYHVEYLIGYEGNAYSHTGNVEEDILSITAVHPMREDAVRSLISRSNADQGILDKLVNRRVLIEIKYKGKRFYLRKFDVI